MAQLGTVRPTKDLIDKEIMVRPERFELPASWFVARRSIQLSYGRKDDQRRAAAVPNIAWPMCCGSTLGRVRGANITTSNADDHSIAEGRVGLNVNSEHLSMFNKINMFNRRRGKDYRRCAPRSFGDALRAFPRFVAVAAN
jgi:hypothetical protein